MSITISCEAAVSAEGKHRDIMTAKQAHYIIAHIGFRIHCEKWKQGLGNKEVLMQKDRRGSTL
jgi:hypothetical protein